MIHSKTTEVFKASVISSLLLFITILYSERLWSELWILFAFLAIGPFVFFCVTFIRSLKFWANGTGKFKQPFIPFCVNLLVLFLVYLLPLNWIRNWSEFHLFHHKYESAAGSLQNKVSSGSGLHSLPIGSQFLSVSGEVYVANNQFGQAVLFYTRRDMDSYKGFVKVSNGINLPIFAGELRFNIYDIKDLGNNWYYIKGN